MSETTGKQAEAAALSDPVYAELFAEVEFALAYIGSAEPKPSTRRGLAEQVAVMLMGRSESGAGKLAITLRGDGTAAV